MTAVVFTYQVIDRNSQVVPGASVRFMQGFRPGDLFHDPERRTPARNPMLTDSAGRVRVYLAAGETYEVTIETPRGDLTQFVHVARADGETVTQTVEVEKIVHVPDPEQAARIAELEARLAEAQARPAFEPHAEPEPIEIPAFLKAPEAPPADLADLFDPADTVPESNEKLLVRLREVLGLIGLAEDAGGRAAPELYRRKDRLESGIRWNRGRSAEAI